MPTVLITGGHAGLGLVAARTFAGRYGCDLILAGRSQGRLEAAAQELRTTFGVSAEIVTMDLTSLASVRNGAARCKDLLRSSLSSGGALQGIVCNAGGQFPGPVSYGADGYEVTFAGNCLGHFLLTNLLLDSVAPGGRIVWTASGTHDPNSMDGRTVGAAVEPDAPTLARQGRSGKPISGGRRYATSKLCTILYAYELDRRLRRTPTSIGSIAYDPGFLPEVGMGRMAPSVLRSPVAELILRTLGVTMGRMPFSGEALAMLAADPAFADVSGRYFQSKNGKLREARSSSASYDEGKAIKLWRDSEDLVRLGIDERPRQFR